MILKLSADEAEEVRRALSSAYNKVIRDLGESGGIGGHDAGLELCSRKWAIEAVLRQMDHPPKPAPVLNMVLPDQDHETLVKAAA
jgi:hypothetical protein